MPLALVASNIRFAASEVRVYDYSVREYDAAATTRIPQAELQRANRELVSYFTADDPGPLHIVVTNIDGRQEELFNARETVHLADVRDLFQATFTVQTFAIAAALVLAVVLLASYGVRVLARALLAGSALTVALVAATGGLAYLGFDDAWRQFHFLAFTNDLWQLDPNTDHLIQMFPRDFWFDITLLLGALTMLEALVIGAVSGLYLYFAGPEPIDSPAPFWRPAPRPLEPRPRVPPPRPRHLMH